jgi:hypothetical protein
MQYIFNLYCGLIIAHIFLSIIYRLIIFKLYKEHEIAFKKQTFFFSLNKSEIIEKISHARENLEIKKQLNFLLVIHNILQYSAILIWSGFIFVFLILIIGK